MGRSRSSQIVRPSQEQICLGFWKRPAERAMMPQANLWKDVWSAWAFPRPPQGSMCPTGTSMSPAGGGTAHLFPEFPVILDKGWFPRPRSSSPSSTTRLRPITSHTFEGKQQPQLSCPLRRAPHSSHLTFSCLSSIRKVARPSASARMLPRSPLCWNETPMGKRKLHSHDQYLLPSQDLIPHPISSSF